MVKTMAITRAKKDFNQLVHSVRGGKVSVKITLRGLPVAQLVPIGAGSDSDDDVVRKFEQLLREKPALKARIEKAEAEGDEGRFLSLADLRCLTATAK